MSTHAHVIPTPRRTTQRVNRLDRTTLARLGWGVAALGLAIYAQGFLEKRTFVTDGALLLVVSGLVFARAARGTLPELPAMPRVSLPTWRDWAAFAPGAAVLSLGVALNLAGLALFGTTKEPTNAAWLLYASSAPVALAGVYLLDGRPSVRGVLWRNRWSMLGLGVILLVALAMRTVGLAQVPFGLWADEAMSGLDIVKILNEPDYRPIVGAGPAQGLPAMAWYLTAPFMALLGPTELALRLPAALAGVAGVAAVYLLGRVLFGRLTGLVASGVMATMAWHVTFSRIAMHGVYSVALDAASLALLALAVRTGRRSLFALSGLALGLSVNFYFAARLFGVVAALFLLHHLLLGRLPWLRRNLGGLILFALMALMAAGPLLLLAYQQPRLFNERTETVSVFKEVERAGSYEPLIDNVRKHVQMFNVIGDGNGRHNLPGAPMLERTTAALAVVGLLLALSRAFRPEFLVVVLWLFVMLQGGILTLAFEAPQGYRTIDNTVAAALLAALPVAALGQRLGGLLGAARTRVAGWTLPTGHLAAGAVATLALVPIGFSNVDRYFERQARDSGVWASHSTPETLVGREIASGRTVGKPYVDQTLMDHPATRFLAPSSFPHERFDAAAVLPFRDPEGATVFLGGEATAQVSTVRRLYPDARVVEHRNPAGGPIVLYELLVGPDAVARVQGLDVAYWTTPDAKGEPASRGRVESVGAAAAPADAKLVEWRGVLNAPDFGRYAFKVEGPPEASLKLDETELTTGGQEAGVTLPRGNHSLSVRAPAGAAGVQLLWRTPTHAAYVPVPHTVLYTAPVTNNGLLGSYYRNTTWSGEPGLQQIDPSLQLRFHLLPLPRPYSVEWRGKLYVPSDGAYRLGASSRDESWIYLDERMVVDASRDIGGYVEGGVVLTAGFHDLRIRYVDRTGHTFINVFWTPPGRAREPLPTELLFPPQGSYPDKVVPPPPPAAAPVPTTSGPGAAAKPVAKPGQAPAPAPAVAAASRPGITTNASALSASVLLRVGGPGDGPGQFTQPRAVAVDKAGNLYVADTNNKRIHKFDPAGQHLLSWGEEAEFADPLGIVVDSAGRILVLDSEPGWIKRYTPDGKLVDQFGGPNARFYHPRGLSIDAADNLYIADTGGSRVVKYNGKGEMVEQLGQRGNGPGQLGEPTGAAADPFGNVWVADSQNAKLLRFAPGGAVDVELSLPRAGSLHGPHVAVDAAGDVYVTDPEGGKLYVVGSDGSVRGMIQAEELRRPVGISIAPDGRIAVGDVNLHHVVVLAPPGPGR